MKRHIQNAGSKKWFGDYFCELESEPLKAIDQWASAYEGCIISGGSLALVSGTTYNVAAAMVVLKIDGEYKVAPMPITNNVDVSVQKAIRLKKDAVTGQYQNPVDLTVAYDYSAEIIDYTAALGTLNQDYLLIPTNGNAIRMYADVLKEALAAATTGVKGLMSAADKAKLDGIVIEANKYVHPANHSPSIIQQDSNNRFVTDAQLANFWSGDGTTKLTTTKKIGIGLSSPNAKLDIEYSNTDPILRFSLNSNPADAGLQLVASSDFKRFIFQTEYSGALSNALSINRQYARVGIGMDDPTEKLQVNGNIKCTDVIIE